MADIGIGGSMTVGDVTIGASASINVPLPFGVVAAANGIPAVLNTVNNVVNAVSDVTDAVTGIAVTGIAATAANLAAGVSIIPGVLTNAAGAVTSIAGAIGNITPPLGLSAMVPMTMDAPGVGGAFQPPQWGIYLNNAPAFTVDTTLSIEYKRDYIVADYPMENGAFQTYDKVQRPSEMRVTVALGGTPTDRRNLLKALSQAIASLTLYNVMMPEGPASNMTIQHFDFARRATNGLEVLIVTIHLLQINQTVAAQLATPTTAAPTTAAPAAAAANAPAAPSGASPAQGGTVQAAPPTPPQATAAPAPSEPSQLAPPAPSPSGA